MVGAPNERWVIDLTGPYPTSGDGSKFIFTAICAFSKFVVTATLKNKEATTVTKCIIDNILLKFGLPFEILSDRGPEFQNQIAQGLYDAFGVSKLKSSAYKQMIVRNVTLLGILTVWTVKFLHGHVTFSLSSASHAVRYGVDRLPCPDN
jgi:hypothetical protein